MAKEYRVNVYKNEFCEGSVVSRVRYNSNLDFWNGSNWSNGGVGRHLGLTKLKTGDYVLIYGTDWQGERDFGVLVSAEDALQAILKSQNLDLLKTKKFNDLNLLAIEKGFLGGFEYDDEE
jgi:hypothetical protein